MTSAFEQVRLAELSDTETVIRRLAGKGAAILEIGAGTGWQSRALADMGYTVASVDLPAANTISNHARTRVWPITDYNGRDLPFPDAHFDIVYSSNVLEHVVELDALDREIHRVLKPGGHAVHLVPNAVWRLASMLSYYPAQAVDAVRYLTRNRGSAESATDAAVPAPAGASKLQKAIRRLVIGVHGAEGNALTELRRFARPQWDSFFVGHGWAIEEYGNNGVFATGDYLAGNAISIGARRSVGRAVGGIAHRYVLSDAARAR